MELQLKALSKNIYPLSGIVVQSPDPAVWLREMQAMGLRLSAVNVYALPHRATQDVWGCLITGVEKNSLTTLGKNALCQCIGGLLYIPEYASLYPACTEQELHKLLNGSVHIFHPEIGLVEVSERVEWKMFLQPSAPLPYTIHSPKPGVRIPEQIRSFSVKPMEADKALDVLEREVFPEHKELSDKPLSLAEKTKLSLLRVFFSAKEKNDEGKASEIEQSELSKMMDGMRKFFGGGNKWIERLQEEYEDLEQRNKEQIQKLMDLFRDNPDEALKYAIPLDDSGSTRGGEATAPIDLSKLRWDFSLFSSLGNFLGMGNFTSSQSGGGGSATLDYESYYQLQQRYQQSARDLLARKEYHKAAFVYMKLLKDYQSAAQALEQGEFYQEAAVVYLKYANSKTKAAECYEKGKMYAEAIALYIELGRHEKAGDLYMLLDQRNEALAQYQRVADEYIEKLQFLKASLILRHKMDNAAEAQAQLREGWRRNVDAFTCINNYFAHIPDEKLLAEAIQQVYQTETNEQNALVFLAALRHEYHKTQYVATVARNIAYEIIAQRAEGYPAVVAELTAFNDSNKTLHKDITRFQQRHRTFTS